MTGELSEKAINKALESFSWSRLAAQVDGIGRSEGAIDKVLGIVERSEALIIKRDEPDKEVKRDELMASLASFLEGKGLAAAAERVRAHGLKLIEIAAGYRSILDLRAESEGVQMSPELRVSAALENSNQAFAEMLTHGERAFSDRVDLGKANIEAPGGQTYSPDAVHGWLVNTLSGTIAMEAHVNQWFDEDGAIVIPVSAIGINRPPEDRHKPAT